MATASKSIAFAVVVEHGGYGGTTAAPIARAVVELPRNWGWWVVSNENL